ncbi:MAG: drug resistance transporter, EmrB/QacA subfamily [Chitinophagaceae bacterium]|nr:drug resistance transporter, EmrB/QacA subfamily [Chitinophagaceae bacterium]
MLFAFSTTTRNQKIFTDAILHMTRNTTINKKACLVVLLLGTSMAAIDSSIVNLSLPVMRRQFSSNLTEVQWVLTAYMLSFSIFIPLTDWLKNRIGFFNLYVGSTAIFTVGSLLCGLSHNLNWLVAARVLQAIGGGAITPTALAIISTVFHENERGRAIGIWGLGIVMGPALGPTLGGILTQHFDWPSIFFVNIPIGLVTLLLSYKYLRFLKAGQTNKEPFDVGGFISLSVFLIVLQYSITKIGSLPFLSITGVTLALLLIGSCMFFFYSSRKRRFPLLDLSLFTNFKFVNGLGLTFVRSVAMFGGLFLLPFLLQGYLGYSETASGLIILPNALMVGIIMPVAGRWVDSHGYRSVSVAGLAVLGVSMFLFAQLHTGSALLFILAAMLCRGAGFGLLTTPLTAAVISAVPKEKVAMGSSINTLIIQLSGAIGVSVISLIHQVFNDRYRAEGAAAVIAEHHALMNCFLISGFLLLIAIIPALKLPAKNVKLSDKQILLDAA